MSIVWLRRDLRLDDHVALLRGGVPTSAGVVCAFVLDPPLLRGPRVGAPIVQFFFDSLRELREQLQRGRARISRCSRAIPPPSSRALARRTARGAVLQRRLRARRDRTRRARCARSARSAAIEVHFSTDHVYFGAGEVLQTAASRTWSTRRIGGGGARASTAIRGRRCRRERACAASCSMPRDDRPDPRRAGAGGVTGTSSSRRTRARAAWRRSACCRASCATAPRRMRTGGTCRRSTGRRVCHRTCARERSGFARSSTRRDAPWSRERDAWLGELIWRDFYQQLLAHHPRVAHEPFLDAARAIPYREDPGRHSRAWCEGRTGYPIVDAAMVQLNTTGWMHNRLRMIVASFLTKHLLIDYPRRRTLLRAAPRRCGPRREQRRLAVGSVDRHATRRPIFVSSTRRRRARRSTPTARSCARCCPRCATCPRARARAVDDAAARCRTKSGCVIGRDYPAPIVDHAFARRRALRSYAMLTEATAVKTLTAGIRYSSDDDCGGSRRCHGGGPTSKPREHQLRIRPVARPSRLDTGRPGRTHLPIGRSSTRFQTAVAVASPSLRPAPPRRKAAIALRPGIPRVAPSPVRRGSATAARACDDLRRSSPAVALKRREAILRRRRPRSVVAEGDARSQALSTSLMRCFTPAASSPSVPGAGATSKVTLASLANARAVLAAATPRRSGGRDLARRRQRRADDGGAEPGRERERRRRAPRRRFGSSSASARRCRTARGRGRSRPCAAARRTRASVRGKSSTAGEHAVDAEQGGGSARPTPTGSARRPRAVAETSNSKQRSARAAPSPEQ